MLRRSNARGKVTNTQLASGRSHVPRPDLRWRTAMVGRKDGRKEGDFALHNIRAMSKAFPRAATGMVSGRTLAITCPSLFQHPGRSRTGLSRSACSFVAKFDYNIDPISLWARSVQVVKIIGCLNTGFAISRPSSRRACKRRRAKSFLVRNRHFSE
jgi:hypothetical protein